MRIALISTVFNEAHSIPRWAKALETQSLLPDEFVVVDGGSTDGTPELLAGVFRGTRFPAPRIIVERCNIARGRNLAIENTTGEIIASTDAGSFPDSNWLHELTLPLVKDPGLDAVGGQSWATIETDFQKFLRLFEGDRDDPRTDGGDFSSSRNIAFRRAAWASVGGYPEWLTLAAEDALFNLQFHATGKRLHFNPKAIVHWEERPTAEAYFGLLYRNGFGAAEARLGTPYFLRRFLISVFPPLLLLSRHRFRHLGFRYRKNASSALGWIAGMIKGRRPPAGWKRINGILSSPEAQRCLMATAK